MTRMKQLTVAVLAIVVLGGTGQVVAAIDPGEPLDGVTDLILYPDDFAGNVEYPAADRGTLMIRPDGLVLSGFVLRSAAGMFDGPEPANLVPPGTSGFWFTEDTDNSISGNMGAVISMDHVLGQVIGGDWIIIDPYAKPGEINPYDDLTFTYTIAGTPGTYYGNLIVVPEPATLSLLALGSLVALRRRSKMPRVRR